MLDSAGSETASCSSRAECRSLSGWFTTPGKYTIVLGYVAADGIRTTYSGFYVAGYGETSITLTFYLSSESPRVEFMLAEIVSPPLDGVLLRVTNAGGHGQPPGIELFNGSHVPVYVYSQGATALTEVDRLGGDSERLTYFGCGTGVGVTEVPAGGALPAKRLAPIGTVPQLSRGRYRITARYGLNDVQVILTGGTRRVTAEVDIDGPAPKRKAASPKPPPRR